MTGVLQPMVVILKLRFTCRCPECALQIWLICSLIVKLIWSWVVSLASLTGAPVWLSGHAAEARGWQSGACRSPDTDRLTCASRCKATSSGRTKFFPKEQVIQKRMRGPHSHVWTSISESQSERMQVALPWRLGLLVALDVSARQSWICERYTKAFESRWRS